ncbi:MAG TPA: bifunctional phosphopantothenoylcysteine decarboxylase/phosphopantothenate--cysteine ligase CoaBC [Solirubrobacteraceae bacterium]|jgi:phosphopantothenoylcysteine decarboxylase/phosphopantothenate--cysteine ligase|nr:bifunctional phosphopantothenoylcysteine decarboxylase/phosphopantothenate--cysteine ligase CoaBC [Solirubrobacteraceae bacterium]
MSRILLGVSGGIAAYKALELVRLMTGAGHAVRVVQTPASRRFVGAASFEALTGAPVLVSEFEHDPARGAFPGQQPPEHEPLSHLELVANAEVYVIAPASANTIAKLAAGLADNLLSSCALAADCPLVIAPAMNNRMYDHAATQANLGTLCERGVRIVEPDSGRLASRGEHGVGRLAEPARILAACEQALAGSPADAPTTLDDARAGEGAWHGLRVLVTAGGTREPIDSVRFVGNSSSGRMGLALARAARARGADVTMIAANVALEPPAGVVWREVSTAAELGRACEEEFPACDVLLMAAAVADFRPASPAGGKIKKSGRERLQVELEPTADVIAALAERRRPDQTLVGFAAEHGERAIECGQAKLSGKRLDAVVVNDISRTDIGFEADANEVTILTAGEDSRIAERHVPRAPKAQVATAILDAVETLRAGR